MKQLFFFFGFLFFVSASSAQVIKRDTVKRKAVPVREVPAKKPPVIMKTEKNPVLVEKKPVLKVQNKATIDAKRMQTLKYFKSAKVGSPAQVGGKRELKTMDYGFDAADNTTVNPTGQPKTVNGEICSFESINTSLTSSDFKTFALTGAPDWLKPGIILKASDLVRGYESIEERYDRSPITLATTSNKATKQVVTVANPKNKSSITQAESQLKSQDKARMGAMVHYSSYEVHSEEELNFKVTGKYSMGFGAFAAQLGVTTKNEKKEHYYLMEFNQIVFSIEVDGVDKQNVFINNPEVPTDDYVYLSKVNYGRKAYIMFKSKESLQDISVKASASSNSYGNFSVSSALDYLQNNEEVEIKAVYYGGGMNSVKASILALERRDISVKDFLNASADFAPYLAFPVSYELKNLDNQRVGMFSNSTQTVKTCLPVAKAIKLKVTLAEIECETTSDGDKLADYSVVQHVLYRANGKNKGIISKNINTHSGNCNPGNSGSVWAGSIPLICGNRSKQIHVKEAKNRKRTNSGSNINNSIVFRVTPQEFNDPNASFIIRTSAIENNTNSFYDKDVHLKSEDESVAINDVIAILSGIKTFYADGAYTKDGSLDKSLKFDYFGGMKMQLKEVMHRNKLIALEGPVRVRNSGGSLTDKGFLWVRFELVD